MTKLFTLTNVGAICGLLLLPAFHSNLHGQYWPQPNQVSSPVVSVRPFGRVDLTVAVPAYATLLNPSFLARETWCAALWQQGNTVPSNPLGWSHFYNWRFGPYARNGYRICQVTFYNESHNRWRQIQLLVHYR